MSERPICNLVWRQHLRAADDVEDYYEVARPGDKCVDGSDPFPVYALRLQVTDTMVRAALLAFQSGDMDWDSQDEELMRLALVAALDSEGVSHNER